MNIYTIHYKGSWLGGKAVVMANDAKQAIQLLMEDPMTVNPKEIEIVSAMEHGDYPKVIYNDNGEY